MGDRFSRLPFALPLLTRNEYAVLHWYGAHEAGWSVEWYHAKAERIAEDTGLLASAVSKARASLVSRGILLAHRRGDAENGIVERWSVNNGEGLRESQSPPKTSEGSE